MTLACESFEALRGWNWGDILLLGCVADVLEKGFGFSSTAELWNQYDSGKPNGACPILHTDITHILYIILACLRLFIHAHQVMPKKEPRQSQEKGRPKWRSGGAHWYLHTVLLHFLAETVISIIEARVLARWIIQEMGGTTYSNPQHLGLCISVYFGIWLSRSLSCCTKS